MNNRASLFFASSVSLFLAQLLLRWISAEIPMLADFTHLLPLAAFAGLGLGCLLAGSRRSWWTVSLWVLGALALLLCLADSLGLHRWVFPEFPLDALKHLSEPATRHACWVTVRNLGVVLVILAVCGFSLVGLGQAIGTLMRTREPLRMITLVILGSLAGVLFFALLSLLQTAPHAWLLLLAPALWLVGRARAVSASRQAGPTALLVVVAALAFIRTQRAESLTLWSPAYKIEVQPASRDKASGALRQSLLINHSLQQGMIDLSRSREPNAYPLNSPEGRLLRLWAEACDIPYSMKENPESVLIAGTGLGNEASAALRFNAAQVTAVEPDPGLRFLGRWLHPEHPFQLSRIETVTGDIRPFLRRSQRPFDLIVVHIPGSPIAPPALFSLPLASSIGTAEGMADAARRLRPGGLVCLSLDERERHWLGQRLFHTIQRATGSEPVSTNIGSEIACFVFGPGMNRAAIEQRLRTRGLPVMNDAYAGPIRTANDDWPFLYASPKGQPWIEGLSLALIVALAALVFAILRHGRPEERLAPLACMDWHQLFLGAGFWLLATRAQAECSLLFGSTWVMNALVPAGVFAIVLLACRAVARGAGRGFNAPYALLALALAAWYLIPRSALGALAFTPHVAAIALLAVLPLVFAGVIFAASFARRQATDLAFGAYLLGAVLGGALAAASQVWGLRALTLLAMAFYVFSYLTAGRASRRRSSGRLTEPPSIEAMAYIKQSR